MSVDYQLLKTEIDTDPDTRGYSGMTDQQIADDLNLNAATQFDVPVMSGKQLKQAFDAQPDEWRAIGAEGRSEILSLTARDDLDPHGVDADFFLQAVRPDGVTNNAPNATSALQTGRSVDHSRAHDKSITSEVGELVTVTHIESARATV